MELKDYESAVRSLLELIAPGKLRSVLCTIAGQDAHRFVVGSEISLQERESCCAQLLEVLRVSPYPVFFRKGVD